MKQIWNDGFLCIRKRIGIGENFEVVHYYRLCLLDLYLTAITESKVTL